VRELDELKIESVQLAGDAGAVTRTLAALEIGSRTGALVVAIRRGPARIDAPNGGEVLHEGDIVYLVGSRHAVAEARDLLVAPKAEVAETA
jgi:K+/H+ antiporter YhaU regulatory subunit KhtT